MYYTVYKVTNKMNGKFYIGTHKTKNLDDDYYGSGKLLKRAINKHGLENFEKEILFIFDNPNEMFAKEAEIVNEDFLAEENTYNLKVGGFGGWDYINSDPNRNKVLAKISNQYWSQSENCTKRSDESKKLWQNRKYKIKQSTACKEKWKESEYKTKQSKISRDLWKNPDYRQKTANRISESAKERLKEPKNNSQYGTRWIYSLEEQQSRKIKKTEPIPDGWLPGRKIKF